MGHETTRHTSETALARLREHITAVAGRYKGRIGGWDVVNEALDEDVLPRVDGDRRQLPVAAAGASDSGSPFAR